MNPLEKRIADLEKELAALKKAVADISGKKSNAGDLQVNAKKSDAEKPFTTPPQPTLKNVIDKSQENAGKSSEIWIGRLGIGLLLFGAAFLFKYSIDQGWITPLVRVLFGFALGIVLLIFGLRIYDRKRTLSQLLLGGGIATYYLTIFSAFQLYLLFPHSVAFLLMAFVTILAFLLALKQDEHTLSLLGAMGGFLTPFLLYPGESNTIGLVTYTTLLVLGSSLTYMARGWRLLLWVTSSAAWIILGVAVSDTPVYGYVSDKWVIQVAVILSWLALAIFPALREYWRIDNPDKWTSPEMVFAYKRISNLAGDTFSRHIYLISVSTPLIALLTTRYIWNFSHQTSGYIYLIISIFYLIAFILLREKRRYLNLNFTNGLTAIILFTWAIILILEDTAQFITLGLESWVIFIIAQKMKEKQLEKVAKLLFVLSGFILIYRVFFNYPEIPYIFNPQAFCDLLFLGLLTHATTRMKVNESNIMFFLLAHIGYMGWLLRELSDFDNGQGLVTFTWGILAIIVFILGLRQKRIQIRHLGSITIAIVVAKLFLIDLSELETIYRIILFLTFGGLLLFVSYFLEKLIKPSSAKEKEKAE